MIYSGHLSRHTCPSDPLSRQVMGCDEPAAKAGWELVCWRCLGNTNEEAICPECSGRGKIPQLRCPNATRTQEGNGLFQAYQRFKMYGFLPMRGGLYEQAAVFLNTLELCDRVISYLDRKRAEWNDFLREKAANRRPKENV